MNMARPWRHKRGSWWTTEQKQNVIGLIHRGFSIDEVYRAAGASKVRQSKIWKELINPRQTPPNFPSQQDKHKALVRQKQSERDSKRQLGQRYLKQKRALKPSGAEPPPPYVAPELPVFAPPRELIEEGVSLGQPAELEAPRRRKRRKKLPPSRAAALPPAPSEKTKK